MKKTVNVAFFGDLGSYSETAARRWFESNYNNVKNFISMKPIRKVVRAVDSGTVPFGVVPLENFYNGTIGETLDSLTEAEYAKIIGEESFAVIHCLGVREFSKSVERIFSKDEALGQCSKFICDKYPDATLVAVPGGTSEAASIVAKSSSPDAAIASAECLTRNGLLITSHDLCPNNKTRFAIIGAEFSLVGFNFIHQGKLSKDNKTLIAVHPSVSDEPAVLDKKVLGILSALDLNMEYITSRPDGKRGYYFYIELNGHKRNEGVKIAIEAIRYALDPGKEYRNTVKVLGSYKNTHWKDLK